mmetsp:Transcript_28963/g.83995  ORF Transcript_28963/g.83995 Transcript_28963/m.83995 type:complete len:148 (-) Transcript_28963:190-633(-)
MDSSKGLVYVAGPVFNEGERWFINEMAAVVQKAGLSTFVPHRDIPEEIKNNLRQIFLSDKAAIDRSIAVLANLNGTSTDDGTAWELGYAFGTGKPAVGIFTDARVRFHNEKEVVNLMMQESLNQIVRSLDAVPGALHEAIAKGPPTA